MAGSSAWARKSASAPARCMPVGPSAPSSSPPSNMWCAVQARPGRNGIRPLNPRTHWITPPGPVSDGLTIGLLGGSFDPAHEGHLYVSDIARKALKLDYVWWLVSPGNPLKPAPDALAVRLRRARQIARGRRIIVTGIEERLHTRFTVDSVRALKRRFPQVHFLWLMGSDNLEQFSRW